MSDAISRSAGSFNLESFVIRSYDQVKSFDIKKIIHSFEIHESIKKGAIRGSAKMFDTVGFLMDFPLKGEEFVEICYTDWYGVTHTDKLFIYSISDVRQADPNSPTKWEYTMHFVSRPKIYSENVKIMQAFAGPGDNRAAGDKVSEFVKIIYDQYYGKYISPSIFKNNPANPVLWKNEPEEIVKNLIIEETDGNTRFCVPNYTPEQTMFFFARHAYNASSFSQTYSFFENRKNYVFATNEYLQTDAYPIASAIDRK